MKLKSAMVSAAVTTALMASSALAVDGTINFQGELVASTCDITVDGMASPATVVLPTVSAASLAAAGSTAGKTQFDIGLTNCQGVTSSTTAAAFFENGSTVHTSTFNLINTDTSGADNVQLQLLDATTSTAINVGNSNQKANTSRISADTPSVVLPYAVQYYSMGAATAGNVQSQVNFSIDYD
ncbi:MULTISPECIES: fimbrial protein [Raoultella]|jgi:major type 1 subunit fimbrin (pilin)|uniref:fimbrial protein n=1 Tax=Raoultella TaxID=160674 RepID=UPI00216A2CBA|nr:MULTISPECIES: fimbrial protein [Raoultella]MCS4270054.1 major type 1 subunit fimbrin (pilin) [Raoultella sp. BIGb0132]MCS4287014.1 major type 1 subunit fimbrin (pilin) [Raoultella terrigena]